MTKFSAYLPYLWQKAHLYGFLTSFSLILFPLLTAIIPDLDTSTIQVDSTKVDNNFPDGIAFSANVNSTYEITQVTFIHRLQGDVSRQAKPLEIEPSTALTISYQWDTSRFTIAPSSKILFQWELKDSAGNSLTTPEEEYYYDDIRFDWKELHDEGVIVLWYEGEEDFGEKIFEVASQSLSRMESNTGQGLEFPIIVLLYANEVDFRSWHTYVEDWVGGQAFPSQGITAQIVPAGIPLEWINGVIPHEIAHLFFYQSIHTVWANWPPWLDEGLAQYYEFNSQNASLELAARAAKRGNLIPLMDLDVDISFNRDSEEVHLAYAESISAVTFIFERFGETAIRKLIEAFREGIDTREAIHRAMGLTWEEFEAEWIMWMGVPATPNPSPQPTQPLKLPTYPPPSSATPTHKPIPSEIAVVVATPTSAEPQALPINAESEKKPNLNLCGSVITLLLFPIALVSRRLRNSPGD
jgi:hypothetical protein